MTSQYVQGAGFVYFLITIERVRCEVLFLSHGLSQPAVHILKKFALNDRRVLSNTVHVVPVFSSPLVAR